MGDSTLQDRLRDHAKAFSGLLSLIPAKMYYGEDHSNQWAKEKQTKQEAAAARRAKLDPDSALNRNAKEVMDERAEQKRRLRKTEPKEDAEEDAEEAEEEEEAYEPVKGVEAERPREGLKSKTQTSPSKKPKVNGEIESQDAEKADEEQDKGKGKEHNNDEEDEDDDDEAGGEEVKLSRKEGKRAAKREKKAEKRAEKKAEKAALVAAGETAPATPAPQKKPEPKAQKEDAATPTPKKKKKASKTTKAAEVEQPKPEQPQGEDVQMDDAEEPTRTTNGLNPSLDFSALANNEEESAVSGPESGPQSPTFDANSADLHAIPTEDASVGTSISSAADPSEKPKQIKIPADTTALRARLAAKIEALRAARKADGPDGKPIRTRQELIEARRAKEAQRKEHKKELRRLAKEEEAKKREAALASNSPGVMSPVVGGAEHSAGGSAAGNFSFGRVSFADGSQMSHDLSYFLNRDKKKGPSDPKTALLKVQNQKKRLAELDESKREDAADKETWLTARRRVEGDKIRDDEGMLKRAVKRKEAAKKKSDKAWKERATGVAQAQKERQKKREENIRQRREDKMARRSGKKKKGGAAAKGKGKKKGGRPGFEGSLGVGGRK